jgi:hypothetical protein
MKKTYHTDYLKLRFLELEAHFEKKLAQLKAELLQWFIGVGLFQTLALIVAILLAMIK